MLEKITRCDREDPKVVMEKGDEMSQEGTTKGKRVEEQHQDAALEEFEAKLRMLARKSQAYWRG